MMKRNAEMRTASYVANAFEKDESGILSGSERVEMFMYLGKVIWDIRGNVEYAVKYQNLSQILLIRFQVT